ncbi:MAG: hypothetical protein P8Z79_23760 [Sedimentisphaerales bacterium]|jgi:hypothetical protein
MKGEKDRIDRLLDKNVAEQLARVDWDRLTDAISTRLDQARRIEAPPSKYPAFFKIAAGVAVAAGAVFAVVAVRTREPSEVRIPTGRTAVVKLLDRTGVASIRINDQAGRSSVVVHTGRDDRSVAKCEVEIIDRNGGQARESSRTAWIIISRPERTLADNGHDEEEADVMCLL